MGLCIAESGKHVAFTAGTGVLVFMDLIAYLMMKVIQRNGGPTILQEASRQ